MPISTPPQITVPFATSGLRNAIPATTNNVTGNAGYNAGFGAINMTPKTAGGIPPFGQDFNGIFFDITTAIQYLEAGMSFPYNATFATAVGGYPVGALVSKNDGSGLWRNTVTNNTADPEGAGGTNGWQPEEAGFASIVMTSSNVTLTNLQASRNIIFLSGLLTTNLQLIIPAYVKNTLIVNGCTGAFSVTVKTASGSGAAIPAGMSQWVYCDGINISASQPVSGRLLRTSTYRNNAGTLQVSIDGAAYATASSTFTALNQTGSIDVEGVGGGGGGGGAQSTGAAQSANGSGGGAGGYARGIYTTGITGLTVSVGAGGTSSAGGAGTPGGTTSLGGLISCGGGNGGSLGTPLSTSTVQPIGQAGGGIGSGGTIVNSAGGTGKYAIYGATNISGAGGDSVFGGGAPFASGTSSGTTATSPGAGGSGGAAAASIAGGAAGGSGGGGLLTIREYAK